jgi:putative endonuclease
MSQEKPWWVYIIQTDKDQLYTGITTDVERRWQEHCAVASGKPNARGAKFFRSQSPQKIVYKKSCISRSEASQCEAAFKKLSRQQKLMCINNN